MLLGLFSSDFRIFVGVFLGGKSMTCHWHWHWYVIDMSLACYTTLISFSNVSSEFSSVLTRKCFACMSLNVMRVVRSRYHHSHNIEAHASRPAADGAEEAETSRALTRSRRKAMSSGGHCHGLSFAFCRLLVRTLKWDLLLLFDFLKRTPLAVLASRRGFDLQMCFCCKLSKRLHPSRELKSAKYIFMIWSWIFGKCSAKLV